MSKKNPVLVPQTELTDAELEQVAGGMGVLTVPKLPPPIDENSPERGIQYRYPWSWPA